MRFDELLVIVLLFVSRNKHTAAAYLAAAKLAAELAYQRHANLCL